VQRMSAQVAIGRNKHWPQMWWCSLRSSGGLGNAALPGQSAKRGDAGTPVTTELLHDPCLDSRPHRRVDVLVQGLRGPPELIIRLLWPPLGAAKHVLMLSSSRGQAASNLVQTCCLAPRAHSLNKSSSVHMMMFKIVEVIAQGSLSAGSVATIISAR
jgi:hypothetical protein